MKKLFAIILSLGLIIAPMPVAHAGGGGYAKQILGMSNGIMGASIMFKCKLASTQMSILAYLAGGLTYVAGEILGGKTQGKKQKASADELNNTKDTMKEGGDYQKAVIQSQIDNEKGTLEVIQKRRKWMMATKVIYGIATALAILEIWWSFPPPAGIAKPFEGACMPDGVTHSLIEKGIILAYAGLQATGGSIKGAAVVGLLGAALVKFGLMIGIGTQVADKAISLLSTAYGRIAFFAASTIIVVIIDNDLKKEEEASKKKIADLEKVKGQFELADNSLGEDGETAGAGGGGPVKPGVKDPRNQTYAIKPLPLGADLEKHCYGSSGSNPDYSPAGCKNPIKLIRPRFDASMNIPSLVSGANTAADMADAVASGDFNRADVEAGRLISQAGRIDAINKDLMKKLNDQLKKDGKKPIDINGELNRQITELNKGLNQNSPGSGNYSLADVTGDSAGVSETAADTSGQEITTASSGATVATPAAEPLDLSKIGEGGIVEEGVIDPNAAGNVASLDDSLNKFESSESDISKDPDVSIFKQVSNRYFLNYTKIFQRKEINPPLAEPAPAP